MTDLDPNNLRKLLDEQEQFAKSIKRGDPRSALARQMLAIIAEARQSFVPSPDSTANYVSGMDIIEQLSLLRAQADQMGPS